MSTFLVVAGLVFAIGVWIGVGAPGWPHKPQTYRRHDQKRPLNPIAWGRTPGRERQRPRDMGERRIQLRR